MVPVLLLALRRGWRVGVVSGVIFGLVALVEERSIYYPAQVLLDYPLAYGALGLAGFFRKPPFLGVVVGVGLRFVSHFVSGILFFADFARDLGYSSPEVYSAIYNGSYMIPELIISVVVIQILAYSKALERYL